jgi:phosphonoacetaldehyde hydrolase
MREFCYTRRYCGKLQAVIFDWAGTTVDHGCIAPALVFVEVFQRRGVNIEVSQARAPMGLNKRDHLWAILHMPPIAERWRDVYGRPAEEADVDAMYAEFLPLQVECVRRYADPIPGVVDVITELRKRGIRIGSDTGYSQEIMDALIPAATAAGFEPDCMVCSSDVPQGRPAPWMALENARRLNVYPFSGIVKVDDTPPGIEEGLNAGMWTVGVAETGNEIGLGYEELQSLDSRQREDRQAAAVRRLASSGAHYVVNSVADLLPCLDDIEHRLARGECP